MNYTILALDHLIIDQPPLPPHIPSAIVGMLPDLLDNRVYMLVSFLLKTQS